MKDFTHSDQNTFVGVAAAVLLGAVCIWIYSQKFYTPLLGNIYNEKILAISGSSSEASLLDSESNLITTENTGSKELDLPTNSNQEKSMSPKIHSINKKSFKYGEKVEIRGENFWALENDKIVVIKNLQGDIIYLDTERNQRHSYISFILPKSVCTVPEGESGISDCKERNGRIIELKKGKYTLFYPDFGGDKHSNEVEFTIE